MDAQVFDSKPFQVEAAQYVDTNECRTFFEGWCDGFIPGGERAYVLLESPTESRTVMMEEGDWLVSFSDGHREVWGDDAFVDSFVEVSE